VDDAHRVQDELRLRAIQKQDSNGVRMADHGGTQKVEAAHAWQSHAGDHQVERRPVQQGERLAAAVDG